MTEEIVPFLIEYITNYDQSLHDNEYCLIKTGLLLVGKS